MIYKFTQRMVKVISKIFAAYVVEHHLIPGQFFQVLTLWFLLWIMFLYLQNFQMEPPIYNDYDERDSILDMEAGR